VVSTIVAVAVLFSPKLPDSTAKRLCVEVRPAAVGTYLQNCDSFTFEELAEHPSKLFDDSGKIWQSRPGFVFAGAICAVPFRIANMAFQ
jgi:hypothetical protein